MLIVVISFEYKEWWDDMSRIGIMGGTFNPIHKGHIKLAYAAYKELKLDKVWFMPSKNPPHKNVPRWELVPILTLRLHTQNLQSFS